MTEIRKALLSCIAALLLLTAAAPPAGAEPDHKTVFDFTGYRGGPVLTWLAQQGFTAKQDATSASKVQFSIVGDDLILEAKHNALGLLLTEANLTGFARIRITWGVEAFPEGASYEKGVRSDAAMVYVFFGDEKIASGSMMVPNSPYFIGLFLCQTDPVGRAYQGRYFKAGGRYVCADQTRRSPPSSRSTTPSSAFSA